MSNFRLSQDKVNIPLFEEKKKLLLNTEPCWTFNVKNDGAVLNSKDEMVQMQGLKGLADIE